MKLDRGLIKRQAKGIISGNVFKMFFIYLIVFICMTALIYASMGGIAGSMAKLFADTGFPDNEYYEDYDFDKNYDFDDYDYFENFGNEDGGIVGGDGSDFYNFQGINPYDYDYEYGYDYDYDVDSGFTQEDQLMLQMMGKMVIFWLLYLLGFIAMLVFSPLTVSLQGLYVSLIRGKSFTFGEGLKDVFGNTFKKNYGKKLGLVFLRYVFMYLWSLLLVIPGIIYFYTSYFANQIMCDNPEISPSKALETSKKMVTGYRTELFVMNLSFIPWALLCGITFGLAGIYVMPYMEATNALYYENFRIRAMENGAVTEDDFLSDNQVRAKYANIYANPFANQAPNGNPYYQQGQPNAGAPYQQNANAQYQQPNMGAQPPYGQPNGQGYNPQAGFNPPQGNPVQNAAPVYQPPVNTAPQGETMEDNVPQAEPSETTILNGEPLDDNNL